MSKPDFVRWLAEPPAVPDLVVAMLESDLKRGMSRDEREWTKRFCVSVLLSCAPQLFGANRGPQWNTITTEDGPAGRTYQILFHWPSKPLDEDQSNEALALLEQAEEALGGRRYLARMLDRGKMTAEEFERRSQQTLDPDGSRNLRIELTEAHLGLLREWMERPERGRGRPSSTQPPSANKLAAQHARDLIAFFGVSINTAVASVVEIVGAHDPNAIDDSAVKKAFSKLGQ